VRYNSGFARSVCKWCMWLLWSAVCTAGARGFTVADAVRVSTFLNPRQESLSASPSVLGPLVTFSPNGRSFIAVTVRGDIESGKRIATMWLFDSAEVRAFASGRSVVPAGHLQKILVTMSSASEKEPISDWSWSDDSRSVLFLHANDDGIDRLARVTIDGALTEFTPGNQDVDTFAERNGSIVYSASPANVEAQVYKAATAGLGDTEDATGQALIPLVFPNWTRYEFGETETLWWVKDGKITQVMDEHGAGIQVPTGARFVIGPDGKSLLLTEYATGFPRFWKYYQPAPEYSQASFDASSAASLGATYRPQEYALVALPIGSASTLLNVPIDWEALFSSPVTGVWSPNRRRIAISGAYPPADRGGPRAPVLSCAIGVVDIQTRHYSCVQPQGSLQIPNALGDDRKILVSLRWVGGHELVAEFATLETPTDRIQMRYVEDARYGWRTRRSNRVSNPDGLDVGVFQSTNRSPVLVVHGAGSRQRVLLDPNPMLKDISLGSVSIFRWRDDEGHVWRGLLVKPNGYSSRRRYPLVIQTHGSVGILKKFMVDGPSHTAFAARALAAHGILVLQVIDINSYVMRSIGSREELRIAPAAYREAINKLAQQGLVDPHRVGIIGWSHMGTFVWESLVDTPKVYRAAIIAEGDSNSYPELLVNVDYMGTLRQSYFSAVIGAPPWGGGLKTWFARSPGFRTDRICTPILDDQNSPAALIYGWDDYAILRAQRKPIELFYVRGGDHSLIKPPERLAEQEMTVAWFDYWLNGRKESGLGNPAAYRRWDALRAHLPVCPSATTTGHRRSG